MTTLQREMDAAARIKSLEDALRPFTKFILSDEARDWHECLRKFTQMKRRARVALLVSAQDNKRAA